MKMKRFLFLTIIFFPVFVATVSAQKNQKVEPVMTAVKPEAPTDISFYEKTYHMAMNYNDLVAATQSVYQILSVDSSSVAWKDTLASLFLMRGAYEQAVFVGKQLLDKQPGDVRLEELVAISLQSLGDAKQSLEYYDKLYPKTKNLYHLYQIIVLQYSLARLGECTNSIDQLVADERSDKEQVDINVGQNYTQKVPYKAAALNIKGVIAKQLNDVATAEKLFNEALKVYPDFVLPKGNLEDLKKPKDDKTPVNK